MRPGGATELYVIRERQFATEGFLKRAIHGSWEKRKRMMSGLPIWSDYEMQCLIPPALHRIGVQGQAPTKHMNRAIGDCGAFLKMTADNKSLEFVALDSSWLDQAQS